MGRSGGLRRRRRIPDCAVEGDEIGAGAGEAARRLDRFGVGDAGRLEDFRPPADPLDEQFQRHRGGGAARLAEHDVVGALFPGGHRLVAHAQRPGADDPLGLEAVERLLERLAGARHMDAVGAKPGGEARVILQDQRAIRSDRRLQERRDDRLRLALRARRQPDEGACGRGGGENVGKSLRERAGVGARERRRDEVKRAGRRGRHGHVV